MRVSRSGRDLRITAMVRDRSGRIVLAGTGRAPDSMLVRLRASGARDAKFGNGGLTFRVLGQPPGGSPVYTRFDAVDVAGSKPVVVGSAAGPGHAGPEHRRHGLHRPLLASPSRDSTDALMQPRHVRFVLGLHQH